MKREKNIQEAAKASQKKIPLLTKKEGDTF